MNGVGIQGFALKDSDIWCLVVRVGWSLQVAWLCCFGSARQF